MRATGCVLVVYALSITIAACSHRGSYPSSSERTQEDYAKIDADKEDIRQLWMQIRDWRVAELHLSPDPESRFLLASVFRASIRNLRVCPLESQPTTETCQDVCQYKDAICDNAARICHIANRMPDDTWAKEKCNSAKASCREARERCCGCITGEPRETEHGSTDPAW